MKKSFGLIFGFLIYTTTACGLFNELLEPSDISNLLKTQLELSVFSPTNNQDVGTSIQYVGSVSGAGSTVMTVLIQLDNQIPVHVPVINGSWSTNLPVSTLGKHTNFIYAEDDKGNVSETKIIIVEKKSIPTAMITYPAFNLLTNVPNILTGGSASVPWPYLLAKVEVKVNNGNWTIAGGLSSWSNQIALSEGTNRIFACAFANNGKTNVSAEWKIVRDMTGPVVNTVTPTNNQKVGSIFAVNGMVSDLYSGVQSVMIRTNGGVFKPATILGLSWNTNLSIGGSGNKIFYVYGLDMFGNSSITQQVTVFRSPIPSAVIVSPANGSKTNNASITINGSASVDSPGFIAKVQVQVNGAGWNDAAGTNSWSIGISLVDGTNNIYARAISVDNQTNTSAVYKIIKYSLPAITITSPANGSASESASVSLSGSSSVGAPYSITKIQVQLNGGAWKTVPGTVSWSSNIMLVEGTNTVYARAIADSGATNQSSIYKIIKYSLPVIAVSSPANGSSTANAAITLSGLASVMPPFSISNVQVQLNGGGWKTVNGTTSWSSNITLTEGTNTIYARATANSGASYTSSAWKIMKYSLPAITISSPTNGSYIYYFTNTLLGTSSVSAPYSVAKIQVQVNGGAWSNATGTTSWVKDLIFAAGTNTIYARAITDNGKTNISTAWKIIKQPNGATWALGSLPFTANWRNVVYGNGIFVAMAQYSSKAAISVDGINWTSQNLPMSGEWNCTAYGNNLFVSLDYSESNIVTSPDGITWTKRFLPIENSWNSVTYGNGVFVAVGFRSSNIVVSPDGINWSVASINSDADWQSVTYGNGLFVAVPSGGNAAISSDGYNWTPGASVYGTSVTYGNGLFVAVGPGLNYVYTSTNGITWTIRGLPSTEPWSSVTYGYGIFTLVAGGSGSTKAATSPDGITWTARTLPISAMWTSIAYGNSKFVTIPYNSGYSAAAP
ncbi:MAG: hypothetical protein HPY53_05290 [Brevinematales bacterium]|nr:hypothetical protein [Brevinematales bacterium]